MKKINKQKEIRTCIFSKCKFQKNEMLRFVIIDQKIIFNDLTKKGYYLKIDLNSKIELILKMLVNRFKIINIDECREYLGTYKINK